MDSNTESESEAIGQFREICDVDEETARDLLRESGWDLESAIHQFFYSQNIESLENQDNEAYENELRHRRPAGSNTNAIQQNNAYDLQSRHSAGPITWGQWFKALITIPFKFLYASFLEIFTYFYGFMMPTPPKRRIADDGTVRESRQLMRQQNMEYEQSLAIDRARQEEKLRMEQKKKAGEESLANIASTLAQRKESLKAMRETIRTELQNVLPTATSRQNIDSTKVVKIRINFPNGEKLDNCFSPTDTTELLFKTIFVHDACPDDFCIFIGYPRRELKYYPAWYANLMTSRNLEVTELRTFEDEGILQSDVILIRDNDA